MLNFTIDAEFSLALLGVFAIVTIVATILFVTQQLGIQTYSVLHAPDSPCVYAGCTQFGPALELSVDRERGTARCQCGTGEIRTVSYVP